MDAPANSGPTPHHPESFEWQPTYPVPLEDLVDDVPNVHAPGPPIFGFQHQAHIDMGQGGQYTGLAPSPPPLGARCPYLRMFPLPTTPAPTPAAPAKPTITCTWNGCGGVVSAASSEMEKAARGHLNELHSHDTGLSKTGDVEKFCRCTGCRCSKPRCTIARPHPFHSATIRTHVVRTHFVGPCKRAEKVNA